MCDGALKGLTLERLRLEWCQLRLMPPVVDSVKDTLVVLSVNGNKIASVHPNYFEGFTKLSAVYFADNHLLEIPDLRPISGTLRHLRLSGNNLTEISHFVYKKNFSILQDFIVYGNYISSIPMNVYSAWPIIRKISFRSNNLSSFDLPKFLVNSTAKIRMELGFNPWLCAPTLNLLIEMDTGLLQEPDGLRYQYPKLDGVWIMDYPYMKCAEPPRLAGKWLGELSKFAFQLHSIIDENRW